jgi:asparagine synthase (glutamine-hydrolysing)
MCGIVGILTPRAEHPEQLLSRLRRMGRWQFHRGPDDWGEWVSGGVALGHNRLSIIDLEGGGQPMASPDGGVRVIFNGEIYNFRELRRELEGRGCAFRTDHSDTEVIVHGYAEWGTGVFARLEGMFAIGLWDEHRRRLVLARDRLGIKPLYYHAPAADGVVFASEPKSILGSGLAPRALRTASIPDYFAFRAPAHPETLFEGVAKLPPGTWCAWDEEGRGGDPVPYWTLGAVKGRFASARQAGDAVQAELEQAVSSHAIADVPLGVFLSGGVDSSLVAAMLSREMPVEAFTVGTDSPLDETPFAQTVAGHLGVKLHVLRVKPDDFLGRFGDWAYFNDDPVSDPSALALMLLSEHARGHGMKVMLAGEGADELFGGYNAYQRFALFARAARLPLAAAAGRRAAARAGGRNGDYLATLGDLRYLGTAHPLDRAARQGLFAPELLAGWVNRQAVEYASFAGADPLRRAMLADQRIRLSDDLLPRTDRATMALSLEARVPFLDRRVVELANSLPSRWCVRLAPPQGKWLLKKVAERFVPREVIYRDKRGFDLPLQQWLSTSFRDRIAEYLDARRLPGIRYDFVRRAYDAVRGGGSGATVIVWQWLVLEEWHRQWVEGAATPARPRIVSNQAAFALLDHGACAPA